MTISNSNLQIPLLTSTEGPVEGMAGMAMMNSDDCSAGGGKCGENEGEFWAMLSHQFSEITENNDIKTI